MREFASLWLMNERQCMEVHSFGKNPKYDLSPWYRNVKRWEVSSKDYDFDTPTENSRLSITITFHNDISGTLQASNENCRYLMDILKNYLVPNSRSD